MADLKPNKIKRNKLLRKFRLERSYKPTTLVERPDWLFEDFLKMAVTHELVKTNNFFFIQIGAFDGMENDPIRPLVREFSLAGLVVEPQVVAFKKLQKTYQDYPQVTVVNAAISDKNEIRDFYTTTDSSIQTASFNRTHLVKHNVAEGDIVSHKMQCFTIDTLLREHQMDHYNLLQIDAEGYDYELIKSIDFAKRKPSIIRFEYTHLSETDLNECIHLLASHGYYFVPERWDILAILSQSLSCKQTDPKNHASKVLSNP